MSESQQTVTELARLVDRKIREHEIRVGVVSGIIGAAFFLGTFHAIALLKNELLSWPSH